MGTLLILVGTFSGVMATLPRSGMWMLRIKKGMGFFMIALGEYFLVKAGQLLF
jgi:thiol:disulfide interchange protein DsbD